METRSQSKAKLKRLHESDGNEQRKGQRLASPAVPEPEHTTKITDLIDDCLVKMFGYLDVQSLFNVSIANVFLRPAAREAYKRKFGLKMVEVSGLDFGWNKKKYSVPRECGDNIYICGLKTSLQYLRCFGASISSLKIDYTASKSKLCQHVHQYIDNYCVESLARIEFWFMPNFESEPFQKAFANVEEVAVVNTILEQHLPSIAKWFPNLSSLKLRHTQLGDGVIAQKFQHLEHLSIFCLYAGNQNEFVTDLLRGADQLKSIEIEIFGEKEFPIEALLDTIKDKPSITQLMYDSSKLHPMYVNRAAVQRIINEHPALIELDLPQFQFTIDGFNALIGQLNSLKEIRFLMQHSEYYDLFLQLDVAKEWHTSHNGFCYFEDDCITLASFVRKID